MSRLLKILSALLCGLWLGQAPAAEVAGVKLDDQARLGSTDLQLNGAGLRTKVFFKVYVIGLYLPGKAATGEAVLAQKGPRRVHIVLMRDVSAEDFSAALMDGLRHNSSETEFAALKDRAEALREAMVAAGEVKTGTVVNLDFLPATGTRLIIADKPQGKDIPGEDFNNALLRIWIGARPAQDNLKEALLGKAP